MACRGLVFSLCGLNKEVLDEMRHVVPANGGKIVHVSSDLTHVVSSPEETKRNDTELRYRTRDGKIPVVSPDWVRNRISSYVVVSPRSPVSPRTASSFTLDQTESGRNAASKEKGKVSFACVAKIIPPRIGVFHVPAEDDVSVVLIGTNFDAGPCLVQFGDVTIDPKQVMLHASTVLEVALSRVDREKLGNRSRLVRVSTNGGKSFGSGCSFAIEGGVSTGKREDDLSVLLTMQMSHISSSIDYLSESLGIAQAREKELRSQIECGTFSSLLLTSALPRHDDIPSAPDVALRPGDVPIERGDVVPAESVKKFISQREMNIFISSPFIDMHSERDALVKRVVPRLRIKCSERNVIVNCFDMRWGITGVQAEQGSTLKLCLHEVEKCNVFVGCLGERYGWCLGRDAASKPTEKDRVLKRSLDIAEEDFAFISPLKDRSVTEIEMRLVLRDAKSSRDCLFYLRDPYYVESLEDGVDKSIYRSESEYHHSLLTHLKEEIRKDRHVRAFDYSHPQSFEREVAAQLGNIVDRLFPVDERLSWLERERFAQYSFERKLIRVYVPDNELLMRIDKHVATDANVPLVVTGECGCGKSAASANWAEQYRMRHPEDIVITHHVGCSSASGDYSLMLSRIAQELQSVCGEYSVLIPDASVIAEKFFGWLEASCPKMNRHRVIFVLDGLEHLDERNNARDLVWMPLTFPKGVRVIVTCSGSMVKIMERRGCPMLSIRPLKESERVSVIRRTLRLSSKQVNEKQEQKIASHGPSSIPRFLATLLEGIQTWAVHADLDQHLARDLRAKNAAGLYEVMLGRVEKDLGPVVRDVASLVWASRHGLHVEKELYPIMLTKGMEENVISPVLVSLHELLTLSGGLIRFSNQDIASAVERRYVRTPSQKTSVHAIIARHFLRGDDLTDRKVDELAYQLMKSDLNKELVACLANVSMLLQLYTPNRMFDLLQYWRHVIKELKSMVSTTGTGVLPPEEAYAASLNDSTTFPGDAIRSDVYFVVGSVLEDLGRFGHAMRFFELARGHYENGAQTLRVADSDCAVARICVKLADYRRAEQILRNAEDLYMREKGDCEEVAAILESLGELYCLVGRLQESESSFLRSLALRAERNDSSVALTKKLVMDLYAIMGNTKKALEVGKEALEIMERDLGYDHANVAVVLTSLGHVQMIRQEFKDSKRSLDRALAISETKYGNDHPFTADIVYEIGCWYIMKPEEIVGKKDEAFASENAREWLQRALKIKESVLGVDHPDVSRVLLRLGSLCLERVEFLAAEEYLYRALAIREKSFGRLHSRVAQTLRNLMTLHEIQEQYDRSLECGERALEIALLQYGDDTLKRIGNLRERLALLCFKIEKPEMVKKGIKYFEDAIENFAEFYGKEHAVVEEAKKLLEESTRPPPPPPPKKERPQEPLDFAFSSPPPPLIPPWIVQSQEEASCEEPEMQQQQMMQEPVFMQQMMPMQQQTMYTMPSVQQQVMYTMPQQAPFELAPPGPPPSAPPPPPVVKMEKAKATHDEFLKSIRNRSIEITEEKEEAGEAEVDEEPMDMVCKEKAPTSKQRPMKAKKKASMIPQNRAMNAKDGDWWKQGFHYRK